MFDTLITDPWNAGLPPRKTLLHRKQGFTKKGAEDIRPVLEGDV